MSTRRARLYARLGDSAASNPFANRVASGSQASGRSPPFRPRLPWRGPFRLVFSTWLGFCPLDGGRLELFGVSCYSVFAAACRADW
jgi:hypothetical protein